MNIRIENLDIQNHPEQLEEVSALRVEIFRAYPYLYEGDVQKESEYLATYLKPRARIFLAYDDQKLIGATTCVPMADEEDSFKAPIIHAGFEPEKILYFGESVLKSEYRGRGIGVKFFDYREQYARSLPGISQTMFCAIVRAMDHPKRPVDFRSLESFWANRGYARLPGLTLNYDWREVGELAESPHLLEYWLKDLG